MKTLLLIILTISTLKTYALDNRPVETKTGEFRVELVERTRAEMEAETDKNEKYKLIIGQNEFLKKEDFFRIKFCIEEIKDDRDVSDEQRTQNTNNLLKLFDGEGSTIEQLITNVQNMACQLYTTENKEAAMSPPPTETKAVAKSTTPNFTGLNDFIKDHLYECLADGLDSSRLQHVDRVRFRLPGAIDRVATSIYCPNGAP